MAALVPVLAGAWGVFEHTGGGASGLPSHYRYLSGLLLAIGLGFWTTVGDIKCKTGRFRLLSALVVAGGLARLAGLSLGDTLSWSVGGALTMELLVVPLLCLWQARVGAGAPPGGLLARRPLRTPRQEGLLLRRRFAQPARRGSSGIAERLMDAVVAVMAVVLVPRPTHPRATYSVLDPQTNADMVNVAGRACAGGVANQNGEHKSGTVSNPAGPPWSKGCPDTW